MDSTPEVGSRFRVEIASAVPLQQAAPEVPAPSAALALAGYRILVVDDSDDLRLATARFLRAGGAIVEEHGDPRTALAAVAAAVPPDLALLDLMMPHLDGCELAQQLRSRGFEGPLVALSADGGPDVESRCVAAGFNRCLQKPIRRGALVATIREVLLAHAAH